MVIFLIVHLWAYVSLQQMTEGFAEFPSFRSFAEGLAQDFFWRMITFNMLVIFPIIGILGVFLLVLPRAVHKGVKKLCVKFGYKDIWTLFYQRKVIRKFEEIFSARNLVILLLVVLLVVAVSLFFLNLSSITFFVYVLAALLAVFLTKREIDVLSGYGGIRRIKAWKYENFTCIEGGVWSAYFFVSVMILSMGVQFIMPFSVDYSFGDMHNEWTTRFEQFAENNPEVSQHIPIENFSNRVTELSTELKEGLSQGPPEFAQQFLFPTALVILVIVPIVYALITCHLYGQKWFYLKAFLFSSSIVFSSLYLPLFAGVNPLLATVFSISIISLSMKIMKSLSIKWWGVICPKCEELSPLDNEYCPNCGAKLDKGKVKTIK